MNIAFYVSGTAGRLNKIINLAQDDVIASTKFIFSDSSEADYLRPLAEDKSIGYECMEYKSIPKDQSRSRNMILSDRLLEILHTQQVDYCFSFGAHILMGDLLTQYENRIINFHPSILPLFPGLNAIDQALDAGVQLLGNTAHFIDKGTDTGPIIMQNIVSRLMYDVGGYEAILDQQLPMFRQIFDWLASGRLEVRSGKVYISEAMYMSTVYFPKLEASE